MFSQNYFSLFINVISEGSVLWVVSSFTVFTSDQNVLHGDTWREDKTHNLNIYMTWPSMSYASVMKYTFKLGFKMELWRMEWLKYVECKWVDCGNECGEVTVKMINSLSSSLMMYPLVKDPGSSSQWEERRREQVLKGLWWSNSPLSF